MCFLPCYNFSECDVELAPVFERYINPPIRPLVDFQVFLHHHVLSHSTVDDPSLPTMNIYIIFTASIGIVIHLLRTGDRH